MKKYIIACAIVIALPSCVYAQNQTITGKVIKIADGDTLTILAAGKVQHKIRLAEIDAPEKKQPFGTRSQQHLSGLCFGKQATVKITDRDRYQRVVGRVLCDGTDANLAQVKAGMAWRYVAYSKDPLIEAAEREAKAGRVGLWSDKNPVPPWEWRKARR